MTMPPPSRWSDQPWEARVQTLGDTAERAFEEHATTVLQRGYVRFGLSRPPIRLDKIPQRIRHAPDYLMSSKFVECKGVGKDQILKLKVVTWGSLHWWNDLFPVVVFVWDSHKKRSCLVELGMLDKLLPETTFDKFSDGIPYFGFDAGTVFEVAADVAT